jgi:radical SAM family uncharacterized protein/radical SAM-linked protein
MNRRLQVVRGFFMQMTRLDQLTVERLVSRVQKPGRYIGSELNIIRKNEARVRMALSYPDLYEIGMSNNGLRILYDILNALPDVACERVFAVEEDFERELRQSGLPLYTLETFTSLKELDILGFSLAHELLCTNVLQILDLGGIPLRRSERKGSEPIVIAGGEGVSNPFPMGDFIDAFFIGDGEEGIVEIAEAVREAKGKNLGRQKIMDHIAGIEGMLMPDRYRMSPDKCGSGSLRGPTVRKRIYRGRELVDPVRPIVPNIRIAQERAVVEVARGCNNFCNFCHAGFYNLPYRSYDFRAIEERVLEIVCNTGYNEVTLSSLSISDYPHLTSLINALLPRLTEKGISVSFPSLRVDAATLPLIEQISELRRASLTFAMESASEPIRVRANKRIADRELLDIVRYVRKRGWKLIKLYFMIGLPGCEEHDEAADIIGLLKEVRRSGGGMEINVTISPFVPKPHTPFQDVSQMGREYLERTILRIKRGLPRAIRIKNHDVSGSLLEGVISRGDARIGEAILGSYLQGCRFDSWEEHLRFDIWRKNLDIALPGWESCLGHGDRGSSPWSAVVTGFEKLVRQQKDRSRAGCEMRDKSRLIRGEVDVQRIEEARSRFARRYEVKGRMRLRFAKMGMMRFIPHLDFMEIVKRGLRMADVPVAMTRGFNKRERMSAGFPLPLGIESEAELVDVELFDEVREDLKRGLSVFLPEGIHIKDMHYIGREGSLMSTTRLVEYRITADGAETFGVVEQALEKEVDFVKREKHAERTIPFSAAVHSYELLGGISLLIRLYTGTADSVRIDDAFRILAGPGAGERGGSRIVKTAQYRNSEGALEPIP